MDELSIKARDNFIKRLYNQGDSVVEIQMKLYDEPITLYTIKEVLGLCEYQQIYV